MFESLDMLGSEEGQLNAVFASFGSAAQHAHFFEAALAEFLLAYNKLCKKSMTPRDLKTIATRLQNKSMGILLGDFKKYVKISDDAVLACMRTALERRNFLIHHFFRDREEDFKNETGRMGLLQELVGIERVLDKATKLTNGMRVAMCNALAAMDGVTENTDARSQTLFTIGITMSD
jgi:hypothetical protein